MSRDMTSHSLLHQSLGNLFKLTHVQRNLQYNRCFWQAKGILLGTFCLLSLRPVQEQSDLDVLGVCRKLAHNFHLFAQDHGLFRWVQ